LAIIDQFNLLNTDSKDLYTVQIINPHQLGFMPGKYIAENGLLAQMIIENAAQFYENDYFDLGLLLNQQKAYDMVNLEYLTKVMFHYGFSEALVNSLYKPLRIISRSMSMDLSVTQLLPSFVA
jgi:hypothetical protein